jgi:hypothetical protein
MKKNSTLKNIRNNSISQEERNKHRVPFLNDYQKMNLETLKMAETVMEVHIWDKKMPHLVVKTDWYLIPQYASFGTYFRVMIAKKGLPIGKEITIHIDTQNNLGGTEPYIEMYPDINQKSQRYALNSDMGILSRGIDSSLNWKISKTQERVEEIKNILEKDGQYIQDGDCVAWENNWGSESKALIDELNALRNTY